jgi:hypothetical protein
LPYGKSFREAWDLACRSWSKDNQKNKKNKENEGNINKSDKQQ